MKLDKYLCNLLLIFFTVYFSQGILYQESSFLSKISGIMAMVICSYYFLKVLLIKSNVRGYIIALTIFIYVNVMAAMVSMMMPTVVTASDGSNISSFAVMKSMLLSLTPFFPFYYFSKKRIDITQSLKFFFIVFLMISILKFLKFQNNSIALLDMQQTNNVSYIFVCLLPFILLFKNKITVCFFLSIIFYFVIISGKRGAIFCFIISIAILLYSLMKELSHKSKIKSIFFIILFALIIILFTYETILENDFLQSRMELTLSGNLSGRDTLYTKAWDYWVNSSAAFPFFLGSGYLTSITILGKFAHNDWLEILLSYGLFGIILYIPIVFLPFKYFLNKNQNSRIKYMILIIASIWFLRTAFSMTYQNEENFVVSMMLGFALGYNRLSNKSQ